MLSKISNWLFISGYFVASANQHIFFMEQILKNPSRKKILLWGATLFSSLAFLKFTAFNERSKDEPVKETVKMLTQDGRLVEIDKNLLASSTNKVSNEDLQKWIKK